MPEPAHRNIRLGVSACLLGQEVRYDGGHKRDPFLTETLGPLVEWVPVCPEVEIGLTIPRDPIRLVGDARAPRLVMEKTGEDLTERMRRYARAKAAELAAFGLHGYVLKRASPSCGLTGVPVYGEDGAGSRDDGRGLFAAALADRLPGLPIEEEGRLADPAIRASFIERVLAAAERVLGPERSGECRARLTEALAARAQAPSTRSAAASPDRTQSAIPTPR